MALYSSHHFGAQQLLYVQQILYVSTSLVKKMSSLRMQTLFYSSWYTYCQEYGVLRWNTLSQRAKILAQDHSSPINPLEKVLRPVDQHRTPSSGPQSQCLVTLVWYHQFQGKMQSVFFFINTVLKFVNHFFKKKQMPCFLCNEVS